MILPSEAAIYRAARGDAVIGIKITHRLRFFGFQTDVMGRPYVRNAGVKEFRDGTAGNLATKFPMIRIGGGATNE